MKRLLCAGLLLAGCASAPAKGQMVICPSMQGRLPDGRVVSPILVVPRENVLDKNQEWQEWEKRYPRRYRLNGH